MKLLNRISLYDNPYSIYKKRTFDQVFSNWTRMAASCLHFDHNIMKTCPWNEYPLTPHFYIVKLGFTGVYIIFLFLLQNIDCGYSLEPPRWGGSNVYPQFMFWAKIRKKSHFTSDNYRFFSLEILKYIARTCLRNECQYCASHNYQHWYFTRSIYIMAKILSYTVFLNSKIWRCQK